MNSDHLILQRISIMDYATSVVVPLITAGLASGLGIVAFVATVSIGFGFTLKTFRRLYPGII